jgi:hypothetical protein
MVQISANVNDVFLDVPHCFQASVAIALVITSWPSPFAHQDILNLGATRGCGCSMPIPCRFTPAKRAAVLVVRKDVWILPSVWTYLYRSSNIEPVWPVGSHYTDYAVQVLYYKLITLQFFPCRVEVHESWTLLLQSVIQPTASYLLNDRRISGEVSMKWVPTEEADVFVLF